MFTRASKILSNRLTVPLTSIAKAVGDVLRPTLNQLIKSLFANGEQGFAYDPNDLTTMFQDAAGTVPVTAVGQPVGLMLDKSKGLVRGAELVVNGDFSAGTTGWTGGFGGSTIQAVGGELEVTGSGGTFPSARCTAFASVVGRWYAVTLSARRGSTASSVGVSAAGASSITSSTVSTALTLFFAATATSTQISLIINSGTGTGTAYFDNVSVKELAGNHAYQSTSSMRPLLVASPQRLDYDTADDKLITNLPAQLTGCTVIRSVPNVGTQILTGQTIPTTYNDNTDHCGLIVINRALTATETSQITRLFNKAAGV